MTLYDRPFFRMFLAILSGIFFYGFVVPFVVLCGLIVLGGMIGSFALFGNRFMIAIIVIVIVASAIGKWLRKVIGWQP